MYPQKEFKMLNRSDIKAIKEFEKLIHIIHYLRNKKYGCPWQKAQTHQTLIPFLIEESYEFTNAVNNNKEKNMAEELGDIFLQVMLHAEIGLENKQFELKDIISLLNKKLKKRHPYIFKKKKKVSLRNAKLIWNKIKHTKKSDKKLQRISNELNSKLESIPPDIGTNKIASTVDNFGFKWKDGDQILEKLQEEIQEFQDAIIKKDWGNINEEFGDILFTVINLSYFFKINHQDSLRSANKKFLKRFSIIEEHVGGKINEYSIKELNKFWEIAKNY